MSLTTILIKNLRVDTMIGVYEHEKLAPQALKLDLELRLDARRAARSDALVDTVDYDEVCAQVREFGRRHRHELLESFTHELGGHLMRRFPLRSVSLTAWKSIAGLLPAEIAVRVEMDRDAIEQAQADEDRYND
ncbi:MAG: dihydroneopterin aldolase [Lysobacterales bacterium]